MQKTQKEKAIKQLQAELKEEKLAEIKRSAVPAIAMIFHSLTRLKGGKRSQRNARRRRKSDGAWKRTRRK